VPTVEELEETLDAWLLNELTKLEELLRLEPVTLEALRLDELARLELRLEELRLDELIRLEVARLELEILATKELTAKELTAEELMADETELTDRTLEAGGLLSSLPLPAPQAVRASKLAQKINRKEDFIASPSNWVCGKDWRQN
jgi:hypothetical protein